MEASPIKGPKTKTREKSGLHLYTACVYSWKTQTRHTFQLNIQIILSISFKSLQNLGVLSKSSRKAAVGVFKLPLKTLWVKQTS
ncbi:hypothetical protein MTR67_005519 [Solanum verrucosum]|uniref:Uncharacterized protein n=1 Tax=Solanum verrucosum TaxID=315347 RepID=A0AAF0PW10_SOLVR|nr:hypothetical protein MTR67_005519 [Solanum verrucosum]